MRLAAVPMPLRWLQEPQSWRVPDETWVHVVAGARTDWVRRPAAVDRSDAERAGARRRCGGDYLLSARVTVDFAATYDAGVLVLHEREDLGAKLCFEYSPQREPFPNASSSATRRR